MTVEVWVTTAPLAVKVVKGVVAPTVPKETVPPVPPFKVKFLALLMGPDTEILAPAGTVAPFVVSMVISVERGRGPVKVTIPPLVVRLPARLIAEVPV